jgi:hypothetical protein
MIDAISFWGSGYSAFVMAKVSDTKSEFYQSQLSVTENLQDFRLGSV